MIVALAFLAIMLCASPVAGTWEGCNRTRAAVLECIHALFDLDGNGIITPVIADVAISRLSYVPAGLTWQFVMRCDLNEDGVLTMADWNMTSPNVTSCLPTQNCLDIACNVCVQNGFAQAQRSDPPGPSPVDATPESAKSKLPAGKWKEAQERAMREQELKRLAVLQQYKDAHHRDRQQQEQQQGRGKVQREKRVNL
jgi:hypothetical protein